MGYKENRSYIEVIILILIFVISSCGGYDLRSRDLAFLSNDNVLYVSEPDGSDTIKLTKNVKSFKWIKGGDKIQVTKNSLPRDSEKSNFSVYRMPMSDVKTVHRVRGATKSDTAQTDQPELKKGFKIKDKTYRYRLKKDSLLLKKESNEENLIYSGVQRYELKR